MNTNYNTAIKIPGLPATLYVDTTQYSTNDMKDSLFLVRIWRFYNDETDPRSLINRVELWKDRTKTYFLHVYFHQSGCGEMQRGLLFDDVTFHHHQDKDWCKFQTSDLNTIKGFLTHLLRDHNLLLTTYGVIKGIRSML